MRRARKLGPALGVLSLGALVAAPAAGAHGLPTPPGVPIPGWLFSWGAAIILIASAVGLARLWRAPRLQSVTPVPVFTLPRGAAPACGAIGVLALALVVVCGLAGTQAPALNLAPTFVYVVFWVALVPVSLLFGDVFRAVNPWRAAALAAGKVTRRVLPGGLAPPLPYPDRLGRWPAVAGIAAFAWVELAYTGRSAPATLALLALAYAALQLLGMAFFGISAWTERGDAFSVYFGLFARVSIFDVRDRVVLHRPLLSGLPPLAVVPGTVALLCVMLGSTSFDGLSSTSQWRELAPRLQQDFTSLGLTPGASLELASTLGLVAMVALIAAVYRAGLAGMRSVERRLDTGEITRSFVHTLVPIAAGYVLAHYFTFLVIQGQALGGLISDPLGHGADLFGTAGAGIDATFVPSGVTWYCEVAALVAGHVAALALAHDRALVVFREPAVAARSQQWMLCVMVGYTGLGLFLLSSIAR